MKKSTQSPELRSLLKAIEIAEGQMKLSRALNISQTAVSAWVTRKKRVPSHWVLHVERLTGVTRYELRPDLYPVDPPARISPLLEKRA